MCLVSLCIEGVDLNKIGNNQSVHLCVSLCIEGVDLNILTRRRNPLWVRLPLHRGSGFKHILGFYRYTSEMVSLCIEGVDLNTIARTHHQTLKESPSA